MVVGLALAESGKSRLELTNICGKLMTIRRWDLTELSMSFKIKSE